LLRLKEYDDRTLPLIDFYKANSRFHRIDGFRDVEEVQKDLRKRLEKRS
jgi:adenylate kinase family enzyme